MPLIFQAQSSPLIFAYHFQMYNKCINQRIYMLEKLNLFDVEFYDYAFSIYRVADYFHNSLEKYYF